GHLSHDHTVQIPVQLGGSKLVFHPPLIIDIKIDVNDENPNEGTIRIVNIDGKITLDMLPLDLTALPWPTKPRLLPESDSISVFLRSANNRINGGSIDF